MTAPKDGEGNLGRNVLLSEEQRAVLLDLIKVGYKSGGIQSEQTHDLVKSIRLAVDFSEEELEIRHRRTEKKIGEARSGLHRS